MMIITLSLPGLTYYLTMTHRACIVRVMNKDEIDRLIGVIDSNLYNMGDGIGGRIRLGFDQLANAISKLNVECKCRCSKGAEEYEPCEQDDRTLDQVMSDSIYGNKKS